jgi:hypothetical protein
VGIEGASTGPCSNSATTSAPRQRTTSPTASCPDDQAEEVEVERFYLRRLRHVLNWQQPDGPDTDELTGIPERRRTGPRETTAYRLISTWVLLRTVDVLVKEIGEAFNGTREKLLSIREHLLFLSMDVVLREPLDEELEEMRGWVAETPATQ